MWKALSGEEYVFKVGTEVDLEEDGGDPSLQREAGLTPVVVAGSQPTGQPCLFGGRHRFGFLDPLQPATGVLCPGFLKMRSKKEPGSTFVGTGEPLQLNSQVGWARMFGGGVDTCEGTHRDGELKRADLRRLGRGTLTGRQGDTECSQVAIGILGGKNLGTEVDELPGWH